MTTWDLHSMAIGAERGAELVDLNEASPQAGDAGSVEWAARNKGTIKVEAVDGHIVRLRINGEAWIADVSGRVWTLKEKA